MTAVLGLEGIGKRFVKEDRAIIALRDLDLTVEEGTFVTLLGRSGCGKPTLLNMLAGLTAPTSGTIRYRGEPGYQKAVEFHTGRGLLPEAPSYEGISIPEQ